MKKKLSMFYGGTLPALVAALGCAALLTGCELGRRAPFHLLGQDVAQEVDARVESRRIHVVPRFIASDGREVTEAALAALVQDQDYLVLSTRPGNVADEHMQAELLGKIRSTLGQAERQGITRQGKSVREPALGLAMLSRESNVRLRQLESPFLTKTELESRVQWSDDWAEGSGNYSGALQIFLDQDGAGLALPIRGLGLPVRVIQALENQGVSAVPRQDRPLLPPVVLPMPEDELNREASLPRPQGSSEMVYVPEPPSFAHDLQTSAIAWEAAAIRQELDRPLTIVMAQQEPFHPRHTVGEAIKYFDAQGRVLQILFVDGRIEKYTENGIVDYRLVPVGPVVFPRDLEAQYILALIPPER